MKIGPQVLASFLERANKHTYASDGKKAQTSRLASEDYDYTEGELTYHDTYFGSEKFIGEEIVYQNGIPVWGMNYYGWLVGDVTTKDVYRFLKTSLMQKYSDIIPVRGPKVYAEENYNYENMVEGGLDNFIGEEKIFLNGHLIYRAYYHGGSL